MSILITNLKIYNPLEHRSAKALFLRNIFMIFLVFLFSGRALYELKLDDAILNNQYPFSPVCHLFFAMFFMGMTVGGIRLDIITKPFSYCLPDTHNTHRRVIFLIVGMIIFLLSIVSFLFSEKSFLLFAVSVIIISVASLPAYFIAIFQLFYFQNKKANKSINLLTIPVLILLAISVITDVDIKLPLTRYISVCLFPLALSSIMSMIVLWKILDDKDLKKICFGKNYSSSAGIKKIINSSDEALVRKLSDVEDQDEPAERYLLNKVCNMPLNSMSRYLLGVLYSIEERCMITPVKSSVINLSILFLITLSIGYIPVGSHPMSHYPKFLIVFLSCYIFAMILRPFVHNIFLPASRSKQFYTYLMLWIMKTSIIILWYFLVILVSYGLKNIVPELNIIGHNLSYRPISWSLVLWPAVIIPVIDIFISFPELPCSLFTLVCFILLLFVLAMVFLNVGNPEVQLKVLTAMITISNVFYLIHLTRYWFRRDTV